MQKFTKIGATIGPASEDKTTIENMVKAGMNFARLNFAHGTYEWYEKTILKIRAVEEKLSEPVALLQDLQGPRIRVGTMPDAGFSVSAGQELILDTAIKKFRNNSVPVDERTLHLYLKPKERILIDDGRVELVVKKILRTKIFTKVTEGGRIFSNKGINLPDSRIAIDPFSAKDRRDLEFGIKNGVDLVGLSFVSSAKEIRAVRSFIKNACRRFKKTGLPPLIIAKIERHEAVKNIREIIAEADGIMVARGDLGLELPKEEVPIIQKQIIDLTRGAGKPVIIATQLLDSMRENRRPTRAEVSDVANSVLDQADALLLTNETAAGKYPVEAVKTMAEIAKAAERSRYYDLPLAVSQPQMNTDTAMCRVSRFLSEEVDADFILASSITGKTGRMLSEVRPKKPIFVASASRVVCRQLNVSRGVRPFLLPSCPTIEDFIGRAIKILKKRGWTKAGERMVVVAGEPVGEAGRMNLVEVKNIH